MAALVDNIARSGTKIDERVIFLYDMILFLRDRGNQKAYHKYSNQLKAASPGRVAQSVRHLTGKSEVLGSIPGLATYFRFSFR